MRIGIMQPYLLPYIGYFQLISHVDRFVIYDDIQYTKKGWINRNRFLRNGEPVIFTVPLRKASDYLDVRDREVADAYDAAKLVSQISNAYRKAPAFNQAMPLIEDILSHSEKNLFEFIRYSVDQICDYLSIDTPLIVSSSLGDTSQLKGQERVLALCSALSADAYVNPIGGLDMYRASDFRAQGIDLAFIRRGAVEYEQFNRPFVPDLSILDVLMFNSAEHARALIDTGFELVEPNDD